MGQIQVGDVVQLKSGGPRMTVTGFKPTGVAICVWFDSAEKEVGLFNVSALTKTEDGD